MCMTPHKLEQYTCIQECRVSYRIFVEVEPIQSSVTQCVEYLGSEAVQDITEAVYSTT